MDYLDIVVTAQDWIGDYLKSLDKKSLIRLANRARVKITGKKQDIVHRVEDAIRYILESDGADELSRIVYSLHDKFLEFKVVPTKIKSLDELVDVQFPVFCSWLVSESGISIDEGETLFWSEVFRVADDDYQANGNVVFSTGDEWDNADLIIIMEVERRPFFEDNKVHARFFYEIKSYVEFETKNIYGEEDPKADFVEQLIDFVYTIKNNEDGIPEELLALDMRTVSKMARKFLLK